MRRDGGQAAPRIENLRQERRETRQGDRVIIQEGDRTLVRDGGRLFIRNNESNRFAVGARDVRVERRGLFTETVVYRPNGMRIVTVTDANGRFVRRLRRDASGRDFIIIDNGFGARRDDLMFLDLAPLVVRMPRERYIVEADFAGPDDYYRVFTAPPVEMLDQPYTLDQIRFNAPLRDRMPRVDLGVTFDTGSWQLSPDQIDRLAGIAAALNRAIALNPAEVYSVEGYTDAVGNDVDNLSLSDRRAEAVAVVLTEEFKVPAENLVTQGYGEQYLKVPTAGPERANRRVSIRRITPLMGQVAPPPGPR